MKRLFEKIFKKDPDLKYIITEYHPGEIDLFSQDIKSAEYDENELTEIDEMQIDKIYRCL